MNVSTDKLFHRPPTATGAEATPMQERRSVEKPAVSVTIRSASSVDGAEALEHVSDEDLRRDDALGGLFGRAFDLSAPPMPEFSEETPAL